MGERLEGVSGRVTSGRGNRLVSWLFVGLAIAAGLCAMLYTFAQVLIEKHNSSGHLVAIALPLIGVALPLALASYLAIVASRRFQIEYSRALLISHIGAYSATVAAAPAGAILGSHITFLIMTGLALDLDTIIIGMVMPFAGLVFGAGLQTGRVFLAAGLGIPIDTGRLAVVQAAIRMAGLVAFVEGLLLAMAVQFRGFLGNGESTDILAFCLIASLPVFAFSAGSNAGELGRNPALKWIMRLIFGYSGSLISMFGAFVVFGTIGYAMANGAHWFDDWSFLIIIAPVIFIMMLVIGVAIAGVGLWLYMLSLKKL